MIKNTYFIFSGSALLYYLRSFIGGCLLLPLSLQAVEPMTNNQIRDLMIKDTLNSNSGCPCPYSPDNLGGQCGTESLYYKPGAHKIYCYRVDISSEDVYFYRLKKASGFYPEAQEEVSPSSSSNPSSSTPTGAKDSNKNPSTDPYSTYFKNNSSTSNSTQNGADSTTSYFKNNVPQNPSNRTNSIYLPANAVSGTSR